LGSRRLGWRRDYCFWNIGRSFDRFHNPAFVDSNLVTVGNIENIQNLRVAENQFFSNSNEGLLVVIFSYAKVKFDSSVNPSDDPFMIRTTASHSSRSILTMISGRLFPRHAEAFTRATLSKLARKNDDETYCNQMISPYMLKFVCVQYAHRGDRDSKVKDCLHRLKHRLANPIIL
jgi:hypothetical protein